MSFRPQKSSRRGARRGRGKGRQEKAKRKVQKYRSGGKYLIEKNETPTFEEAVEKILERMHSLGDQIFAFSPFSQYFDDWLLSLKSVLSEFELNPAVNLDEEFLKERSQIITDIERKLAERRLEEAVLEEGTRNLAEQNHLLVQIDSDYAYETQRLASEKNNELKRLTRIAHDLEKEFEETRLIKAIIFSPFARKEKKQKMADISQKLSVTKSELESVVKTFEVEQEKLHDMYQEKKQTIIEKLQRLERKIEGLETDVSMEDRRITCEILINAVKALVKRNRPVK
jgi:hypothetical protein